MKKLSDQSELYQLNLPHLDVVLEEVFSVPGAHLLGPFYREPRTIGDLKSISLLSSEKIYTRLEEVILLAKDIECSANDFNRLQKNSVDEAVKILDVRVDRLLESPCLQGAVSLDELDIQRFICESNDSGQHVVAVCQDGKKSFSAAMFLKKHGLKKIKFLSGGLNAYVK